MKGVILHGGHGTRLRPLTHTGPKQLIPIANKPTSQYVLENLTEAGIREVAIILGGLMSDKVKEYYGDGSKFRARIYYAQQANPAGIAHAVGLVEEFVNGSPFVVYLGDNLLKGGIAKLVREFEKKRYDAMVLLCKVENPKQFGVAEFGKDGRLVRLVEKPKEPPSNYALTGIYFLTTPIFKMIRKLKPSWRGELEITEALQLLIDEGYSLGYEKVEGWWKDTGTVEDILEANRLILDDLEPHVNGKVEDKTCIQGRVAIEKGSIISQGALVRGPVIIGKNVTIQRGVYVGPYTSIGDNVTVRKGEIENSIVMDNCVIEVDGRIVDSLMGPNSEVTANSKSPMGHRLIVGESSRIVL